MEGIRIWIVDLGSAPELRAGVEEILSSRVTPGFPYRIEFQEVPRSAFSEGGQETGVVSRRPHLVLATLGSPSIQDAKGRIALLVENLVGVPIILVVGEGNTKELFRLLEQGIVDFITAPLKSSDVLPRIWRSLERQTPEQALTSSLKKRVGLRQLIGESSCFLTEVRKIPLFSRCDAAVLLLGETGTGKDLFARAIHYLGPRSGKPFVPVSCGAIPVELAENELFGHAPEAFTGASSSRAGLVEEAHGGTLFLDEIDCLRPMIQVKLLRLLQEKEFKRLGSSKLQHADVRVIAATNIDLEEAVRQGKFRGDLYYRLNVLPICLPPLRDRGDDIVLLANHFLGKWAGPLRSRAGGFTPGALERLTAYGWPGNVRELENVVQRAAVLSRESVIRSEDIVLRRAAEASPHLSFREAKSRIVADFERSYIQSVLRRYRGNITHAANAVCKNRRAFWELIRKHRIDVKGFVPGPENPDLRRTEQDKYVLK